VEGFNEALNRSSTSNDASNTQSSKGTDQSQGTSNSYHLPLATRPPLNLAILAKPAPPYAGETPKGSPSKADPAPEDDKKAPADTTQDDKQSSQSSKPDLREQLKHIHLPPTDSPIKGPTNDPNGPGYDNYKNRTPPERDPNPTHGLKPPSIPGNPSYNTGQNGDANIITLPVGKQAPKPTPDQEQNQTPYQPPNSPGK
jgi:hypothetical protein